MNKIVTLVYKEFPVDNALIENELGKQNYANKTPIKLTEHEPCGDGDVHYVLVDYDDGTSFKVCRPDTVAYKEQDTEELPVQKVFEIKLENILGYLEELSKQYNEGWEEARDNNIKYRLLIKSEEANKILKHVKYLIER
jgi:hypothetical protein